LGYFNFVPAVTPGSSVADPWQWGTALARSANMASLVVEAEPLLLTVFASLSIRLHCKSTATAVASLTSSRHFLLLHLQKHPHTGCEVLLS
jgi:hypothetical protein